MANDVRVTLGMDTKQADDALKKYQINVKKAGLALSAIGAAGGLAIKKFTSAALEQEKALAGVLNSARNTGEAMAGFEDKVLSATAALQNKTNFGDEEQLRVLTKMIPVLGSTENALAALPAIMDAAATTGRDLSSQSETLTKALAGQVHTAESLGIKFDQNADFQERLAVVMGLVGGAAEAQADPFTQLNNAFGDMQEELGAVLLPLLSDFASTLQGLVARFKDLSPAMKEVISFGTLGVTAFAGLTGATILFGVALKGVLATSIAFIATPVGAVIMGIAAAVAAVIIVFKNWDRIVHGVKVSLNVMIDLVNKTVVPAINNLIKAFNAVSPVNMGLVPEMEKLDTTFVRITEAIGDTGNAIDDLDVNLEKAKGHVEATNDEFAKFRAHLKALTQTEMTDELKASIRLSDAHRALGLKVGATKKAIDDLVKTGYFNEIEAINEVARRLEDRYIKMQDAARQSTNFFNQDLFRQANAANTATVAINGLANAHNALAGGSGGSASASYMGQGIPVHPLMRANPGGVPGFSTGETHGAGVNVSVTVNATTGANASDIAKEAVDAFTSVLGSSAVSSENTRSS